MTTAPLAEDIAVLDQLSVGRLEPILAAGYAPHEFDVPIAGSRCQRL